MRNYLGQQVPFWALLLIVSVFLTACGGGGSNGSAPVTYTVGGSVSGLLPGTNIVLQNNGGNSTPVTVNSSFTFSTGLASGAHYSVTVQTQPVGETCTVANASGAVSNANISVAVSCTPNNYTVAGSVAGLLPGNIVTLEDNGANPTQVSANGPFAFSAALPSGSQYAVSVHPAPLGQSCAVMNGSGTLAGANVTNVKVTCSTLTFPVRVSVFGLLPNSTLTLQNNGGDDLTVTGSGVYTFKTQPLSQSAYAITVLAQPSGQICSFRGDSSGTINGSEVDLLLVCPWHVAYIGSAGGNTIIAYHIDPTTGTLLPVSAAYSMLGTAASGMTVTQDHRFLYATSFDAGTVSAFAIDPHTGALSSISRLTLPINSEPQTVSVDASGKFAYVASTGIPYAPAATSPSIFAYSINATSGALTPLSPSPYTLTSSPSPLIADPVANFAFAPNGTYTIDSTGALSLTGTTVGLGCMNSYNPKKDFQSHPTCSVAVDPAGKFVYASYPGYVSSYRVNPSTGGLTAALGSPYAAGSGPASAMTVTPNGRFVYVANGGAISEYSVEPTTGALTTVSIAPFSVSGATTTAYLPMAVDPSGKFLYVSSDEGGTWAFSIDAITGALTSIALTPFPLLQFIGGTESTSVVIVPLL
jgi:6-phosphogluconolactonase (cycloisomerase 2 family)